MPRSPRYNLISRVVHWAMAIGFLFMWVSGFVMTTLIREDSPLQDWLIGLHISVGASLVALLLFRVGVRIVCPPPPLPFGPTRFELAIIRAGHAALYAISLAVLVFGWASVNRGHAVVWFGLELPALFEVGNDDWSSSCTSAGLRVPGARGRSRLACVLPRPLDTAADDLRELGVTGPPPGPYQAGTM